MAIISARIIIGDLFLRINAKCNRTTVKPRYSAPAFNKIPPIEHINFSPKKYFHNYSHVGNSENLDLKHNFDQSLKIRYRRV